MLDASELQLLNKHRAGAEEARSVIVLEVHLLDERANAPLPDRCCGEEAWEGEKRVAGVLCRVYVFTAAIDA